MRNVLAHAPRRMDEAEADVLAYMTFHVQHRVLGRAAATDRVCLGASAGVKKQHSQPEQHAEKHGTPPDRELGAGTGASQPCCPKAWIIAAFLPDFGGLHVNGL
jgi:hypothetical protein